MVCKDVQAPAYAAVHGTRKYRINFKKITSSMASFHTHIINDLVEFENMYETRIKELWELAARFGLYYVDALIKVLEFDLALREKEFTETDPKALVIENAKKMNRYLESIYREWSRLGPLLMKKQHLRNMGGKIASKEKAEIDRSIQHVRNQTCYNKRRLIDMDIDGIEHYVELLKSLIENN